MWGLVLISAEFRTGCGDWSLNDWFVGEVFCPKVRFGDEDIVVTVVVAVRGRSMAVETAAFEEAGILPVSSSLRILDFKSSSSSQTVDGAVVDTDDSVPASAL